MATITVTTLLDVVDDDGLVSLREAIQAANSDSTVDGVTGSGADIIRFDAALAGGTIRLLTTELELTSDITINGDTNGDRRADITISGDANGSGTENDGDVRIFKITGAETDVDLLSLTLTNGHSTVN